MDKTQALEKLRSIGQQHLLQYFDTLTERQRAMLLSQIESLNIPTFRMQQQMLVGTKHTPFRLLEPFTDFENIDYKRDQNRGQQLIAEGKVGCLIIAGGQGTRLCFDGPKGSFPTSVIKKKSLFQLFAEKIVAAGKQVGRKLPVAIMTSPLNHNETIRYFEDHLFFGLDFSQLIFFTQKMLPLLNHKGDLFLDETWHIAVGPDGNGSSLKHFVEDHIWDEWYKSGVRYVSYVLVDNPLADPFDAELTGYHHQGADVIMKCTSRKDPEEKVGIVIRHEDKVKIIEYSELPKEERTATLEDGTLKHRCANLSLFSFTMDFIKQAAKADTFLHLAHKAVKFLNETATVEQSETPNAWKFEEFIFDVLPLALKVKALLYPREQCFAPLKNIDGDASIETVRAALQARDRQVISQITGLEAPNRPFELSQEFYYPSTELLEKWKGKSLPDEDYITLRG